MIQENEISLQHKKFDDENPIFSIVVPFVRVDEDVLESLENLANEVTGKPFEFVCVHNALTDQDPSVSQKAARLFERFAVPFVWCRYSRSMGASQAWCEGIRQSRGKYVCLTAIDVRVTPGWAEAVMNGVSGSFSVFQGDYSGIQNVSRLMGPLEQAIDRARFFGYEAIDFRNCIIQRSFALRILKQYFNDKFFSDFEIGLLKSQESGVKLKMIPEASIVNVYPSTLKDSLKRKFRHGISVGRILKHFHRKYSVKRAPLSQVIRLQISFNQVTYSYAKGLRMLLSLRALHSAFFVGHILGTLLPPSLVMRFYVMHFDEELFVAHREDVSFFRSRQ